MRYTRERAIDKFREGPGRPFVSTCRKERMTARHLVPVEVMTAAEGPL